jgi:hypothetical protein
MPAPDPSPGRAVAGGIVYAALVFAIAFAMGVTRTLVLAAAPGIPRLAAVLVEAPILIIASWFVCRFVARRLNVPARPTPRAIMGAAGFACVLAAEVALSVVAGGRTIAAHVALYADPSHAVGLVAQMVFAIIPLVQGRTP